MHAGGPHLRCHLHSKGRGGGQNIKWRVLAGAAAARLVESKLTAVSEADALARVRSQGMTPIAVDLVSKTGMNRNIEIFKTRVKPKDLAVFSRQFATMLASGLPILRCLTILAEQSPNPTLKGVLAEVTDDDVDAYFTPADPDLTF